MPRNIEPDDEVTQPIPVQTLRELADEHRVALAAAGLVCDRITQMTREIAAAHDIAPVFGPMLAHYNLRITP